MDFDPPYDRLFSGILSFKNLEEAENTLIRLENLRQRFLATSDKKGVDYCRRVGRLGRRRAELIAHNRRVSPRKRDEKTEIAMWFEVWVESPEIFPAWLSLRKKTPDYARLQKPEHPAHNGVGGINK